MSSAKKSKPKTIKSVSKKDLLTLVCEWNHCLIIFDEMTCFINHVTEHLSDLGLSVIPREELESQEGDFKCQWRDCGHRDVFFQSMLDLIRHVYFHAFHVKLKCIGVNLMLKNKLNTHNCSTLNRNTIPDLPERFTCSWQNCGVTYDNPELFYQHVAAHCDIYPNGNFPPGGCRCYWTGCEVVVKSKHKLKEHLRSHSQEKIMSCPTCGSLFSNATKFFDHLQRQTEGSAHNYQCSHCNKRYSSERLLRDHMRHHVYHYKCPFCDMTCPNPSSLRTHIHYRHTEERAYHCPTCDYSGKSAVDLRRHVETHDRDWINCEAEGCSFHARYFWEMNLHNRNVHQGPELGKYLCHICSKKYLRGSRLTNHLKSVHRFKWPSGHTRFRYKQHEDGYYRLLTVRYESLEMTEQLVGVSSTSDGTVIVVEPDETYEA